MWGRADGLQQGFVYFFCILAKKKKKKKQENKKRPNIFPFLEFVRLFVVVQHLLVSFFFKKKKIYPSFSFVPVFLCHSSLSLILPNSICCKKEK